MWHRSEGSRYRRNAWFDHRPVWVHMIVRAGLYCLSFCSFMSLLPSATNLADFSSLSYHVSIGNVKFPKAIATCEGTWRKQRSRFITYYIWAADPVAPYISCVCACGFSFSWGETLRTLFLPHWNSNVGKLHFTEITGCRKLVCLFLSVRTGIISTR